MTAIIKEIQMAPRTREDQEVTDQTEEMDREETETDKMEDRGATVMTVCHRKSKISYFY